MLLAAGLSGVALLGTWASVQWAPTWADKLTGGRAHGQELDPDSRRCGAIVGTILAALAGDWIGREPPTR